VTATTAVVRVECRVGACASARDITSGTTAAGLAEAVRFARLVVRFFGVGANSGGAIARADVVALVPRGTRDRASADAGSGLAGVVLCARVSVFAIGAVAPGQPGVDATELLRRAGHCALVTRFGRRHAGLDFAARLARTGRTEAICAAVRAVVEVANGLANRAPRAAIDRHLLARFRRRAVGSRPAVRRIETGIRIGSRHAGVAGVPGPGVRNGARLRVGPIAETASGQRRQREERILHRSKRRSSALRVKAAILPTTDARTKRKRAKLARECARRSWCSQ